MQLTIGGEIFLLWLYILWLIKEHALQNDGESIHINRAVADE